MPFEYMHLTNVEILAKAYSKQEKAYLENKNV